MEKHKRFKKLSHSVYEGKNHGVFCAKYRYRVLKDEVGRYTEQLLRWLSEQKEVEVLELNVQADPVHRVLNLRPK